MLGLLQKIKREIFYIKEEDYKVLTSLKVRRDGPHI